MDAQHADALAQRIWDARRSRRTLPPLTGEVDLSLRDAYAVQQAVQRRREAQGQRRAGYKLGYTSAAMRQQMGVETMNFGPLTDAMLLQSGDRVGDDVLQPRVEPEIAFLFDRDVTHAADRDDVLAAVGAVHASLEVVDSVWTDYRFRIEDNTADGSSASYVVLGDVLANQDLPAIEVVLERNGEATARATGAAASGHPAEGVVWLVGELAARGERIHAGDLIITGGLTLAVPLEPGDVIRAVFDGSVEVAVRR